MRGRPPVPTEIKKQNGNPGHRPLPDVVVASGKVPALVAPPNLSTGAQEVWDEIVPELGRVGLLDGVDALMLELLCVAVDRAREAGKIVDQEGMIIPTARGGFTSNPAVRIERDAWEQARKIGEQFALTPVSRTRLGVSLYKGKTLQAELEERLYSSSDNRNHDD